MHICEDAIGSSGGYQFDDRRNEYSSRFDIFSIFSTMLGSVG